VPQFFQIHVSSHNQRSTLFPYIHVALPSHIFFLNIVVTYVKEEFSPLDAKEDYLGDLDEELSLKGIGRGKPNYLAIVDVDPTSPNYSKVVHRLPVTHFGDELHHSSWNACSSFHGNASSQRRYLILPSLVSGCIYAIDTAKDPRAPVLYKVVER